MCFKNCIVLSILVISINSNSYINPENSDDIVSEAEAESWRSNSRLVLLVCHKNKWRDLSQKLVTSLFLFIERGQENIFIGPKNILIGPKNIFNQ